MVTDEPFAGTNTEVLFEKKKTNAGYIYIICVY